MREEREREGERGREEMEMCLFRNIMRSNDKL